MNWWYFVIGILIGFIVDVIISVLTSKSAKNKKEVVE